jgi:hypothetical protein
LFPQQKMQRSVIARSAVACSRPISHPGAYLNPLDSARI